MRLAVNKMTALRVVRSLRSSAGRLGGTPCDLPAPDASPQQRWTAGRIPLERLALQAPPSKEHPLNVAVPKASARVQASFASNTVYSQGLPEHAFLDMGEGLVIPSPELLFVELANVMSPATHALLGYELCGTFSRDAQDPRTGSVAYGIKPATSVEKIAHFLAGCKDVHGMNRAHATLCCIADNAWSPMEAIVASMAALPVTRYGYELGPVILNSRKENAPELVQMGTRESRVPDIEIVGTPVGFNYDGHEHLDLASVASAQTEQQQAVAISAVREKYRDDMLRNRELAAQGHVILPVTAEDLFKEGALDTLMLEAALAIEALGGRDTGLTQLVARARFLRKSRQLLIWSLLPWDNAEKYAREFLARERAEMTPGGETYDCEVAFPL